MEITEIASGQLCEVSADSVRDFESNEMLHGVLVKVYYGSEVYADMTKRYESNFKVRFPCENSSSPTPVRIEFNLTGYQMQDNPDEIIRIEDNKYKRTNFYLVPSTKCTKNGWHIFREDDTPIGLAIEWFKDRKYWKALIDKHNEQTSKYPTILKWISNAYTIRDGDCIYKPSTGLHKFLG